MKIRKIKLSTTHLILLSFLFVILIGSVLLALPISSADGNAVSYIDALFTATTATCVTGLVTVTTATAWSVFGQIVILILIQLGGLGIITVLSGIMIAVNRRIGLNSRILLQDSFNLDSMSGLVRFVKKVVKGTLIVEGVGALIYMTVFVPQFGLKGVWFSVFNSISAFCNAGMDIISDTSLYGYYNNFIVNAVTMTLIVLGGIGFIVWWDVIRVIREKKKFKHLRLHSKIAIATTIVLILSGAAVFFIFEYNNPLTIKEFSLWDKIQASLFQSVTTRTAGFATIPQENLTNASSVMSLLLMFIGGSPVGTAGGVKTVTVAVLLMVAVASAKEKKEVGMFNRNISLFTVKRAVAVTMISFITVFISVMLLSAVESAPIDTILYECVSASATVGLSKGFTASLSLAGKLIIAATMYFGRVGPITLFIAFSKKKTRENIIKNPTEEISVG